MAKVPNKTSEAAKFVVRLPPKTHKLLKREAKQQATSMNQVLCDIVKDHFEADAAGNAIRQVQIWAKRL